MRRFLLISLCIFLHHAANGQYIRWFKTADQTVTVSGVISDEATGEVLPDAYVCLKGNWDSLVEADSSGTYSIKTHVGEISLMASKMGYEGKELDIWAGNDTTINVALKERKYASMSVWPIPDRFDFDGRFYNTFGVNSICKVAQTIFGLEGRYNFIYTPYDVGLNFYYSLPFTMEPYEAYEDTPVGEVMSYGYWTVQAVADYNYRRWYKIHPFAGIGVGGGQSSRRTYIGMGYDMEDPEHSVPMPGYYVQKTPIAILSLRYGFEYDAFLRFFIENHFNTDGNKGIYVGVTWVL